MASGKTTLGRALAAASGRCFVDLDDYIVSRCRQTITEIFAAQGEAAFRELERRALVEVAQIRDCNLVVACGGGTPCFGDNMAVMERAGTTVWLDAPESVILRRLRLARSERPLVANLDEGGELERYVSENISRRKPYYSRAALRFDSSRLESESEIAESVGQFLRMMSSNQNT